MAAGREVSDNGRSGWTRRRTQDVAAVALLAAGIIGFVTVAWLWDVKAGLASLFVFMICVGVYVGAE